jgi:CBS domain-containing protein
MAECNVAAIAITDGHGHLKGIVTERDLTRRVLGQGLDPAITLLADIMTRDPDTLGPGDTALSALESMKANNCRHMPVVDSLGRIVAMVSIRHMYKAIKMDLEDDERQVRAFVSDTDYGARN